MVDLCVWKREKSSHPHKECRYCIGGPILGRISFVTGCYISLVVSFFLFSALSFNTAALRRCRSLQDAAKKEIRRSNTHIHTYIYICLYTFRIYMHIQYVLFTHSSQIKKKYSMLHKNTLSKIQQFELWECLFLIKILIHRICVIIFKS